MKINSEIIKIHKPINEVFARLSNMENYSEYVPEGAVFKLREERDGFSIQLGAMPEVGLKLAEKQEPDWVHFTSPSENFAYDMRVELTGISENETDVSVLFEGKFNPMIEMMAKKPLTKFIETLAGNIEKKA